MYQKAKERVLLGTTEAAVELDVDVRFLQRGILEGTIPGIRVGRIFKVPAWWVRQQRDGVAGT